MKNDLRSARTTSMVLGLLVPASLVALVASAGCAAIVGADDYKVGDGGTATNGAGGGAGGTGMCGAVWTQDDATCESCMEMECCNELRACADGTACGNLLACAIRNCSTNNTTACLQTFCANEIASGGNAVVALDNCHNDQCGGC